MERDIVIWEQRFQAFFLKHPLPSSFEKLDYLGVRLETGRNPEIKTYLQCSASELPSHEIVSCLREQGLLGHLETVADSSSTSFVRYDARLERRGADAYEALLVRLARNGRDFETIPREVELLSSVCLGTPDRLFCHLGLSLSEEQIKQVKCYLRIPPAGERAPEDTDERLLERLSLCCPDFMRPAEAAAHVLRHSGGQLWMLGADYGGPGRKRKVYLRNYKTDLRLMAELLPDSIGEELCCLTAWERSQNMFHYSGAALCGDRERASLNLYYVTG